MQPAVSVRLRRGPDQAVRHGHPWIFEGAIDRTDGAGTCGSVVDVIGSDGAWIGRGLWNPDAALRVRVFTHRRETAVDAALFAARIDQALALRAQVFPSAALEHTNAYRMVYSEADLLSGLVVDRYADVLSVQLRAKIWEPHLEPVLAHLRARTGLERVRVAAVTDHAEREGLDGARLEACSSPRSGPVRIRESGLAYDVDPWDGQKTGFYLDQRVNRGRVAAYAAGRRLLSAYCYTGAFELHAARGGVASITGIDASQAALDQAHRHHQLNGTAATPTEYLQGDVPMVLRRFRDAARTFDMVVLDPPRFVNNRAQLGKGLRAYKDINLLALKLLTPGGVLATFSCSGLVPAADFRMALEWAARDAGRVVTIMETLSQPPDHPVLPVFPESEYLKGLICWVR